MREGLVAHERHELTHSQTSSFLATDLLSPHLLVDAGRLSHDVVQLGQALMGLGQRAHEQLDLPARVWLGGDAPGNVPLGDRDRLVVTDDGHVDEAFEQPGLAPEGSIHGGRCHTGGRRDVGDRGGRVAALDEECTPRVHHRPPGRGRLLLSTGGVVRTP